VTLHVAIRGAGPPVVLLHGWALHSEVWGPWLDDLAADATLHVVDLPGHGLSAWSRGASTLTALASAIEARLPREATLIGWSLGGMIALEITRLRGDRVPGLVLVTTTPKFIAGDDWPHGMPPALLADFARRLREDYRRTVQNFLALQTRGDDQALATLRELKRRVDLRPAPAQEALETGLGILEAADLRAAVPGIAAPALVISGQHDRLTPPGASEWLAQTLPRAQHVAVEGAAHTPFVSHRALVSGAVRRFLADHLAIPRRRSQA
jgi:pimeloyl-[acyl-carrier protein] methyl ester esterase